MATYTVQPGQTFFDAVLMACGTMESTMDIVAANGISVTDIVAAGTLLIIPDGIGTDKAVLKYLAENKIVIGTKGEMIPPNALLNEDGTPILNEDGSFILVE